MANGKEETNMTEAAVGSLGRVSPSSSLLLPPFLLLIQQNPCGEAAALPLSAAGLYNVS